MSNQHNYPLLGQAFIGSKVLSANFTLTGTDSGKGFTNASAAGAITINLPKAAPGLIYYFLVVATQTMTLQPVAADVIRGNAAGVALVLGATAGTMVTLVCVTAGFWEQEGPSSFSGGLQTTFTAPTAGQFRVSIVQPGTANGDLAELQLSSGAAAFALFVANAANASAIVTNGPTGAQGVIRTLGSYPIVFGTNNTYRGDIGATGTWTLAPTTNTAVPSLLIKGLDNSGPLVIDIQAAANGGFLSFRNSAVERGFIGTGPATLAGAALADFIIGADTGILKLSTGNASRMEIAANGSTFTGWGAVAGALVDMAPDSGTFTVTITGCTTAPTGTAFWWKMGNLAVITLPAVSATSNSTALTFTGLPAALQPAHGNNTIVSLLEDNGVNTYGTVQFSAGSGTMTCLKASSTSGASWTAAGTKGLAALVTIAYSLG